MSIFDSRVLSLNTWISLRLAPAGRRPRASRAWPRGGCDARPASARLRAGGVLAEAGAGPLGPGHGACRGQGRAALVTAREPPARPVAWCPGMTGC
jgi:hypothetical protein